MGELRIPQSNLRGLRAISLLSDDELNELYEVLRKLPKGINYMSFSKMLDSLKFSEITFISSSIFSLGSLLNRNDVVIDSLPSEIAISYEEQQEDSLLADFNRVLFEERIKYILLNINSLKITFQAFDIIANSNNVVRNIDVSSETRIIFDDDFKTKNGLIFHSLEISYDFNDKDGLKRKFILDQNDLKTLKAKIESALLYEENIKINNQSIINFIDVTG